MEKIPDNILSQWAKEDLDNIAEGLSGMTFYVAEGSSMTVKEIHPELTEEELDYVMSKYTGGLARG